MGTRFRTIANSCSLVALAWSVGALAQTAEPAASQQGASQPAQTSRDFGSGDIVVTANKREQNLSNVGLTISAMSGDQLANQRIANVADLAKATPGLAFAPTPNATPVYTLRGVGFFETSLAAYPDVSVYIDQVPLSLPVMTTLTAFDLERVEVLKGPQGTLFGNNATGGAINFVAAKPTRELAAGFELGLGRFRTLEVGGFISGPITDTLRARASFKAVNGDEWQYSYTRKDKMGKADNIAGRFLLDWDASDRLKFALNVNGWKNRDDPQASQYTEPRLQNQVGEAGLGGVVPADVPILLYPVAPKNARAADWNPNLRPFANHTFWQTALRGDYEIADDLTLTSITSFSKLRFLNATNGSGTALELQDIGRDYGRIKSFTQEVRLANGASNPLRYTLGANYERTTVFEVVDLYIRDTTASIKNGFNGNQYGSDQTMKNYAVFGNLEYDITDQFTVKGGVRRTKAKRVALESGAYEIPGFFADGTVAGVTGPNALTRFFNTVYGLIYGAGTVPTILPGQSNTLDTRPGSPTYLQAGNPDGRLSENSTSWSVGVDFKPQPGLLFYANVSKGFKAGSFPTLAGAIYDAYAPVVQEELLDYEVGFKMQMFDRKVSISGAAFYYDYKNKQTRAKFIDPIFGSLDKLLNIPKSKVKGAEFELNARPFDGLSFTASGTYLDAKVKKYEGTIGFHVENGLNVADTASFNGVPLPFAPKFQYSVRLDYQFPLSDVLSGFVGAGANGQTKTWGSVYQTERDRKAYKIDGYTLVNLSGGVGAPDDSWRLTLWGKNVFNTFYASNVIQGYDNLMRYTGRPAEYGATVAFRY